MMNWPKDNSTVSFEDLIEPIVCAINFAYTIKRKNINKNVPWNGLNTPNSEHVALSPNQTLKAENLKYSEECQGRDALTEIIGIAIRLGIE